MVQSSLPVCVQLELAQPVTPFAQTVPREQPDLPQTLHWRWQHTAWYCGRDDDVVVVGLAEGGRRVTLTAMP